MLPLGQGELFEELVGPDDEHRGCGFEAYASLNADYGVAHVHVAPYSVGRSYLLHFLDCGYSVVIMLPVHLA